MTKMICQHCQSPFPALRPDCAKHCGHACRTAAWRQRLRREPRPVMACI
jgi:hypothetical protein